MAASTTPATNFAPPYRSLSYNDNAIRLVEKNRLQTASAFSAL